MPLSNRAPVNAAGQIMVTGTTPTPAWPVLGGMTYDPVTGELAVTSAVPNTTDPWVGGLRFTNLGALYIVTTIPSPVFYVGGLPVSTLGQLFMSANPPVGSVGGWPIAGDGGVAGIGSGIGPVPIFWAPLITTLVPVVAGNPAFTFTRATTAYVADQDGILRQAIANEARFQGARRVRNLSSSFIGWPPNNATITPGVADPFGGTSAFTLTATANGGYAQQPVPTFAVGSVGINSIWIKRRTGTGTVNIRNINAVNVDVTAAVTSSWTRVCSPAVAGTLGSAFAIVLLGTSGDAVDVWGAQCEDVSGQSNQAPGEYVSVGVLSSPWHGCGIDGCKAFATTNGNSVAGNIVTEAQGTLIPAATLLGYVAENAATNLCLQSQTFDNASWVKVNGTVTANNVAAPDGTLTGDTFAATSPVATLTQTITTTATAHTFSLYVKRIAGTGSVAFILDGTVTDIDGLINSSTWTRIPATKTVTAAAHDFSLRVSTLGDSVAIWGAQLEASDTPTSYVPTVGATVTRNFDDLQYPIATNVNGSLFTMYSEFYMVAAQTPQRHILRYIVQARSAARLTPTFSMDSPGGVVSAANAALFGTVNKGVSALSGSSGSVCLNGGAVGTGVASAFSSSGNFAIGGVAGVAMNGSVRNVKCYDTRLGDADLITLTA